MKLRNYLPLVFLISTSIAYANTTALESDLNIDFEFGPSLKIFGAKDDSKKIVLGTANYGTKTLQQFITIGGWIGGRDTSAVSSYGLALSLKHFTLNLGYGYLFEKNNSLGTHWGFDIGARAQLGSTFIGFRHYSNGAKLFDHDKTPNYGLNFITLGVKT